MKTHSVEVALVRHADPAQSLRASKACTVRAALLRRLARGPACAKRRVKGARCEARRMRTTAGCEMKGTLRLNARTGVSTHTKRAENELAWEEERTRTAVWTLAGCELRSERWRRDRRTAGTGHEVLRRVLHLAGMVLLMLMRVRVRVVRCAVLRHARTRLAGEAANGSAVRVCGHRRHLVDVVPAVRSHSGDMWRERTARNM